MKRLDALLFVLMTIKNQYMPFYVISLNKVDVSKLKRPAGIMRNPV